MSLDQLRNLRRANRKPASVTVVIGRPPLGVVNDGPGTVLVDRDGLDLRPLVGLPVHLIDLQNDADFTLRVIEDLEQLGTRLLGASGAFGVQGVSEEHEIAMNRLRRTLCRTE